MNISKVRQIVIHCSATPPGKDIGRDEIDQWHKANGWWMIGYHGVIRRSGVWEPGRPLDKQGAHVRGNNKNTWGICLVGGVDADGKPEDNFTAAQWQTLQIVLHGLDGYAGRTLEKLGHRDFSPDLNGNGLVDKNEWIKACPCFDVSDKIKEWGMA